VRMGERIGGDWELVRELPSGPDVWRWEVRRGEQIAEAIGLRAHALLWPRARERFAAVPDIADPAALPILARDALDGAPVRVRPRTSGVLPRLDGATAGRVAAFLAPAVRAGTGAAEGELRTEDLVLDADGVPRFAPLGVRPPDAIGRVPFARAPEVVHGAPPDGASDLYGLGVVLVTAVRGEPPWPAPSLAALEARRGSPPPSLGDIDADGIVAGLLATDPAARHAVPERYARPAEMPVLPTEAPAAPSPSPARLTTRPAEPPLYAGSATFPKYVVRVPTARLSAEALARLASRAESDAEAVRAAARRGDTWAIGGADVEADARALARRFGAIGLPATVDTTVPPRVIHYLALAVAAAIGALVSGFPVPFAGIAVGLVYMAGVNFRAMFRTAEVRMAWQARGRAPVDATSLEGRLLAARARADRLPEVAAADVRLRLEEAQAALERARAASWSGGADTDASQDAERAVRDVEAVELAVARAASETGPAR
jgi:hypothetical protein